LIVKAGSRFETYSTSGAAHYLKFVANQDTTAKSGLRLVRDLEHYGASATVEIDRENIVYHIKFSSQTPDSQELAIAAETLSCLLSPLLYEYEFERTRPKVLRSYESLCSTSKLLDVAHYVAFGDQALGLPLYSAPQRTNRLETAHLRHHLTSRYTPENVTIVGTGVSHGDLSNIFTQISQNIAAPFPTDEEIEQEKAVKILIANEKNYFSAY